MKTTPSHETRDPTDLPGHPHPRLRTRAAAPAVSREAHRKLYGTLSNPPRTATHVVCPICGKSSSLKSFPAGGATDIVLQTFRGMGRGKGFSVVSRQSGIEDRKLAEALKPKLFDLISVLAARGHITKAEIEDSIPTGIGLHRAETPSSRARSLRAIEAEPTAEEKTHEFLERELTDLQLGMTKLLNQWREAERRDAVSARRIDELHAHTDRLVTATRAGVESLGRLRNVMRGADSGAKELADHVHKMRAIVEAVQKLRAPKKVELREAGAGHDAR